jgi:hypothetical protein
VIPSNVLETFSLPASIMQVELQNPSNSVRICRDTKIVQPTLAKSLRIHLSSDLECRSSQLAGSSRTSTRSLCNYDLERGKRCFIPRESPLAHFPLFPGKACLFQQLVDPNCPAYRRAPVYCVENLAKFPDIQVFTYMRKIRYVTQDPVYFPRLSCQIVPASNDLPERLLQKGS